MIDSDTESTQSASPSTHWLRDPLIAFFIAGALIFALANYFSEDDSYNIDITEADLTRLTDQWVMQMRKPPTSEELNGLVDQLVKEEVYYREAKRLGLQENDTIVRRRLVQKLTFVTEDVATASQPTEEDLQQYYEEHLNDYGLPTRFTFTHRYFSVDRRDTVQQPGAAQAAAEAALSQPGDAGDPFMLQRNYALRSQREIGDQFGRDFAAELAQLNASDQWQGPIRSAYGWHVVLISQVEPARTQSFPEVRDRVSVDAQQAQRNRANAAYYDALLARYNISMPAPPAQ